jgi:NCAIR mutase (PurE)-related protein
MPELTDTLENNHTFFYANMQQVGNALLDTHRSLRKGFPEVVLAEGKEISDIINLLNALTQSTTAIATRVNNEKVAQLTSAFPAGIWHEKARVFIANPQENICHHYATKIAIVTAGNSDIFVAEEAACLLEVAGYPLEKIYDVGIAALHRLLVHLDHLNECDTVIVVAGMDGALPAVIAGLMIQPVIAVPSSIGYGVAKNGMTALNTMLSSCAPGIAVVNIDNGYGAAMMAHAICLRIHQGKKNAQ